MVIKLKDLKMGEYVSIPNSIAQDLTLSVHARSTIMYILSLPPDTTFTVAMLMNNLQFTDKRAKNTIKELVERGYMKAVKIKDSKGRFVKFDYIVTPIPFQFSQFIENSTDTKATLPWE